MVILDVEMPGRDGLSVADAFARDDGPDIIILSAFDRYAAAAFQVEAIDYLLKPLQPERLRQAIERARRRRAERAAFVASTTDAANANPRPTIHVPGRHGGRDVALADIIWIEAARDYVVIHTATRSHLLRATMTEMRRRLPDSFLRVHRSSFVALGEVRRWGVPLKGIYGLVLSDGSEVPVGPSYVQETRAALRSLDV
ncbi:LytR/AlgR family response regulator transcription factor [Luteibacter yeojuensis]|uniref:LytR/AlgR family response regulator transcription factor n=1 Tax=Luteibacter yeojuensis TaxID=345309 RepID=UPI002FC30197